MFDRSAEVYDALYRAMGKDYAAEVAYLTDIVAARIAGAATWLDVACGTGAHLALVADRFGCTGVDIEPDFVRIASARVPTARFERGEMRSFDLGERFDVVTCLFSAIGYVSSEQGLHEAIATMGKHLSPGGVLLIEPWLAPDAWVIGRPHVLVADEPDLKVVRMNVSARRGDVAILDFHYLVGTDTGVEHFTEVHQLMLFTDEQYVAAFEAAGLRVELDPVGPMGRGLYVATA